MGIFNSAYTSPEFVQGNIPVSNKSSYDLLLEGETSSVRKLPTGQIVYIHSLDYVSIVMDRPSTPTRTEGLYLSPPSISLCSILNTNPSMIIEDDGTSIVLVKLINENGDMRIEITNS